ncbi:hypothetical protein [Halorussus salinisoli]|nr:hypothetical protein [Halorussus salinisoli]
MRQSLTAPGARRFAPRERAADAASARAASSATVERVIIVGA